MSYYQKYMKYKKKYLEIKRGGAWYEPKKPSWNIFRAFYGVVTFVTKVGLLVPRLVGGAIVGSIERFVGEIDPVSTIDTLEKSFNDSWNDITTQNGKFEFIDFTQPGMYGGSSDVSTNKIDIFSNYLLKHGITETYLNQEIKPNLIDINNKIKELLMKMQNETINKDTYYALMREIITVYNKLVNNTNSKMRAAIRDYKTNVGNDEFIKSLICYTNSTEEATIENADIPTTNIQPNSYKKTCVLFKPYNFEEMVKNYKKDLSINSKQT